MPKTPPRKLILIAALPVLTLFYGMASVRYGLFPYPWLDAAYGSFRAWLAGSGPKMTTGFWQAAPDGGDSETDSNTVSQLANNPYRRGSKPAPDVETVTTYDPSKTWNGVNLVVSGHGPEATLQDMYGNTLHTWSCSIDRVWPGPLPFREHALHRTFWRRAHVYPNGDLLAIFEGIGMIKLDRNSNVLWALECRSHHDIFVAPDGTIYTLTRHWRNKYEGFHIDGPILEDFVAAISPDGRLLREVSVLGAFVHSDYYSLLTSALRVGDPLHTNAVKLMDGRWADRHPLFEKGNALISVPTINTIASLDLQQDKIVWAITGLWGFQHDPDLVGDGHLLVFDNIGEHGQSKVVEVEPVSQRIVWSYRGTPEHTFSSEVIGAVQRFDNGNTLITETTTGRAFEVTHDGTIVWEYYNPKRAGPHNELIASLMEVVRFQPSYFTADFAEVHNPYASGDRQLDVSGLQQLLGALQK